MHSTWLTQPSTQHPPRGCETPQIGAVARPPAAGSCWPPAPRCRTSARAEPRRRRPAAAPAPRCAAALCSQGGDGRRGLGEASYPERARQSRHPLLRFTCFADALRSGCCCLRSGGGGGSGGGRRRLWRCHCGGPGGRLVRGCSLAASRAHCDSSKDTGRALVQVSERAGAGCWAVGRLINQTVRSRFNRAVNLALRFISELARGWRRRPGWRRRRRRRSSGGQFRAGVLPVHWDRRS